MNYAKRTKVLNNNIILYILLYDFGLLHFQLYCLFTVLMQYVIDVNNIISIIHRL